MTKSSKNILISINILVLCIGLGLYILQNKLYSWNILFFTFIALLISCVTLIFTCFSDPLLKNKVIRPSILFSLGYLIVFFQFNFDLLIGNTSANNPIFCSISVINISALLSLIGFTSFVLGNLFATNKNSYKLSQNNNIQLYNINSFLRIQKYLLLLCIIVYFYYLGKSILSGEYIYSQATMDESAGSVTNYLAVLIYVLVFTIFTSLIYLYKYNSITLSFGKFIISNGIIFNLSIFLFLMLQFIIGDRGPIITFILAYLISYLIISKKNINMLSILLSVLGAAIALTVIGQQRNQPKLSIKEIVESKTSPEETTISPFTQELASSYKTLTYSMFNIPEKRDFFYGKILIREGIESFPMMHRLIPIAYSNISYENNSPSFCTYLIQGGNPNYGNGSSVLADIYINFGVIGIVVIMFLWGLIYYKFDLEIYYGNNIYWTLGALIFFSFALYISRATILTPLYYFIPSFLVLKLNKIFK